MTDAMEVMLLRWAENSKGRTVTFLLPDDPGDHPFKGEKCGPQQGQRYGMALARIADDESREEPEGAGVRREDSADKPPPRDWHTMAPSQRAGILCNEVGFQKWFENYLPVRHMASVPDDFDSGNEWATWAIRTHCHVTSRKAFDTEERARLRFEELETEYLRSEGRMAEARG